MGKTLHEGSILLEDINETNRSSGRTGELVQLDGSFHDWLEERSGRGCLMHMVDDATSTVSCHFSREETIWAAVGVLRRSGSSATGCHARCTPTGRTCTCEPPRRTNSARAKCR